MNIPKIEIKKILYTTDLSETGRYAFAYAASLANLYGAELTVLHVLDEEPELDRSLAGYISDELWEEIKQRDLQEAREFLVSRKRDDAAIGECVGQFCEESQTGGSEPYVTYEIKVKIGNPVQVITETAESGNYDLIVMGRYGHGSLKIKDAMLGDTARRVVRRAKIPVFIVQLPKEEK